MQEAGVAVQERHGERHGHEADEDARDGECRSLLCAPRPS
jgi:hypothetical protein